MQAATPIKLPFWQDPQSTLAFATIERQATCEVFCTLWDEAGEELEGQLGKLAFTDCWATSSLNTEYPPYAVKQHTFHSYILEIPNSAWLAAATAQHLHTYPSWLHWDKRQYHHYVVVGAGSYLEVLATSYTAGLALPEECRRYAFLRE